ncbi:hypothetical protein ACA910_017474 [Epithemia clementina (nom. ined.)]
MALDSSRSPVAAVWTDTDQTHAIGTTTVVVSSSQSFIQEKEREEPPEAAEDMAHRPQSPQARFGTSSSTNSGTLPQHSGLGRQPRQQGRHEQGHPTNSNNNNNFVNHHHHHPKRMRRPEQRTKQRQRRQRPRRRNLHWVEPPPGDGTTWPPPGTPVKNDTTTTTIPPALATPCGDDGLQCWNGGQCTRIPSNEDRWSVSGTIPACDCSTAWYLVEQDQDEEGTEHIQQFVGPTCQLAVQIEDYCPTPFLGNTGGAGRGKKTLDDAKKQRIVDKDLFCVNGGTCRSYTTTTDPDFRDEPCACLTGFTGKNCEYPPKEEDYTTSTATEAPTLAPTPPAGDKSGETDDAFWSSLSSSSSSSLSDQSTKMDSPWKVALLVLVLIFFAILASLFAIKLLLHRRRLLFRQQNQQQQQQQQHSGDHPVANPADPNDQCRAAAVDSSTDHKMVMTGETTATRSVVSWWWSLSRSSTNQTQLPGGDKQDGEPPLRSIIEEHEVEEMEICFEREEEEGEEDPHQDDPYRNKMLPEPHQFPSSSPSPSSPCMSCTGKIFFRLWGPGTHGFMPLSSFSSLSSTGGGASVGAPPTAVEL